MLNGALIMMKPDFSQMSRPELRAYILAHRDNDDAIEALMNRRNPDSLTNAFPRTDEDLKAMEDRETAQVS